MNTAQPVSPTTLASPLHKYFALAKVDEKSHTVSGIATKAVPDADGEIFDYESAKKAFLEWSKEAYDSTSASGAEPSHGNVRLQHSLVPAAKLTAPPEFRDADQEIWITTEPIDDAMWEKCRKGFVRGFSVGGAYTSRWHADCGTAMPLNPEDPSSNNFCPTCKKSVNPMYAARLAEISYVDNPNVKAATFRLVKADGSEETKEFQPMEQSIPTTDMSTYKTIATEMAKAFAAQLKKSVKYLVSADGEDHLPYTGEDGKPNHRLMGAAWAALHGGYRGKKYEGPDKDKAIERLKAVYEKENMETPTEKITKCLDGALQKAASAKGIEKSMYDVARFAAIIDDFAWLQQSTLWDKEVEQDDSPIPAEIAAIIEHMAEVFVAHAKEESSEVVAQIQERTTPKDAVAKAVSATEPLKKENTMSTESTAPSNAEQITKADLIELGKAIVDGLTKAGVGATGKEKIETKEPESTDPKEGAAPNHRKADTATLTKEDVEKAAEAAATKAVENFIKALKEESDAEDKNEKEDEEKCMKKSAGIGDRTMPPLAASGSPHVRTMPVTKAQDGTVAHTAAPSAVDKETVQKAIGGDVDAVLALMKGAKAGEVPATVFPNLAKMG